MTSIEEKIIAEKTNTKKCSLTCKQQNEHKYHLLHLHFFPFVSGKGHNQQKTVLKNPQVTVPTAKKPWSLPPGTIDLRGLSLTQLHLSFPELLIG